MESWLKMFASTWYVWVLLLLLWLVGLFLPKIRGFFGEKSVAFFLSRLDPAKYKVLHNVMLPAGNKTTQIDHIVVSNYGIFVIETKNYGGWITGREEDEYWQQTLYQRKEKLYNPIRQNYGHIKALQELLRDYPQLNYISIVVFTTRADLKVKTRTPVVYTTQLLKTLRQYQEETIPDDVRDRVYSLIAAANVDNSTNRKRHVQVLRAERKEREEKIKKGICPRCGGQLVVRKGGYGEFLGCSNYPRCKFKLREAEKG